jgi:pilus assembly protein CpaE
MLQMFTRKFRSRQPILEIGFVTQDPNAGEELRNFVSDRESIDLTLIASSSVTPATRPKNIGVLVYDLDSSNQASLREFERFMHERPQDIPVIVLSPALGDELVRGFLRLRVADWIKTPLSPGELVAACGRVLSQISKPKHDVRCLTFIGARGGVGSTALAVNTALILASESAVHGPTCLVDLDFVSGACADYLDLKANWQLSELIPNPDRLDQHMMDIMLTAHPTGISVLAAQRTFSESSFNTDTVTRALDLASERFDNIVIDLPRQGVSWADSIILGSNQLFVVTEFTIPGLKSARRLVTEIVDRFEGEVEPKVIVNKYKRALFGSGISQHEVNEILRTSFAGYVSANPRLMREAIDRGVPTTSIARRNGIVRDLRKILVKKQVS